MKVKKIKAKPKTKINYLKLIIVICSVAIFSTAITLGSVAYSCRDFNQADSSAVIGTWRLTEYSYKSNSGNVNQLENFDFYYFVFTTEEGGYMKYREKTSTDTEIVSISSICSEVNGVLLEVAVAHSSASTLYKFSNGPLQKGTLEYNFTTTSSVTNDDDESTTAIITTYTMVLKKISNDTDVL
jgi:hypothetical protein